MKKQGLLLLVALFSLVGCNGTQEESTSTSVIESTSQEESTSVDPLIDTLSLKDTAHRTSFSTSKMEFEGDNHFKFTVDKASSTTDCADKTNPVRCYKGTKLTFSHTTPIKKMIFDCAVYGSSSFASAGSDYARPLAVGSWSCGTATQTADLKTEVIWSYETGATTITVDLNVAQARIFSIEVHAIC